MYQLRHEIYWMCVDSENYLYVKNSLCYELPPPEEISSAMMCNFDRLQKNVIVFFQTLCAQYWNANSNTPKLGLGGIGKFDFSLMSTRTRLFCDKFGKFMEIYRIFKSFQVLSIVMSWRYIISVFETFAPVQYIPTYFSALAQSEVIYSWVEWIEQELACRISTFC